MQIGFVGLGRMGGDMVHRIRRACDHGFAAFDLSIVLPEEGES